jgi:hypothetical protein
MLYRHQDANIRLAALKSSMIEMSENSDLEAKDIVDQALSSITSQFIHETTYTPTWKRVFTHEQASLVPDISSDAFVSQLFNKMLDDHIFCKNYHELTEEDQRELNLRSKVFKALIHLATDVCREGDYMLEKKAAA